MLGPWIKANWMWSSRRWQDIDVNGIDILGISKLKWMGMDEFNSDDHYTYYSGQESLRKWNSPHSQQESPKCNTWEQSQKQQNDLSSFPRQTIQHHSNPSLCPNQWYQSWMVLWRRTRPSRTNTKKRCPFHQRVLECESRKTRDTQNNRQVWPWIAKWSRAKLTWVLSREHAGHNKDTFPTTQEMTLHMDITRWSILKSDWLYSLQQKMELYAVRKNKTVVETMKSLLPNSDLNWRK